MIRPDGKHVFTKSEADGIRPGHEYLTRKREDGEEEIVDVPSLHVMYFHARVEGAETASFGLASHPPVVVHRASVVGRDEDGHKTVRMGAGEAVEVPTRLRRGIRGGTSARRSTRRTRSWAGRRISSARTSPFTGRWRFAKGLCSRRRFGMTRSFRSAVRRFMVWGCSLSHRRERPRRSVCTRSGARGTVLWPRRSPSSFC